MPYPGHFSVEINRLRLDALRAWRDRLLLAGIGLRYAWREGPLWAESVYAHIQREGLLRWL